MEFFYNCVIEIVDRDDTEEMAKLYAMKQEDIEEWMEDTLDAVGMPDGELRNACLAEWVAEDKIWKLYQYIQKHCVPDEEEDETE
jgi:hypothetical protein